MRLTQERRKGFDQSIQVPVVIEVILNSDDGLDFILNYGITHNRLTLGEKARRRRAYLPKSFVAPAKSFLTVLSLHVTYF